MTMRLDSRPYSALAILLSFALVLSGFVAISGPGNASTSITVPTGTTGGFNNTEFQSLATVSGVTPAVVGYSESATLRVDVTVASGQLQANSTAFAALEKPVGFTSNPASAFAVIGTPAQINALLSSLSYRGTVTGTSTVEIKVVEGRGAVNTINGHYYEQVDSALSWQDAFAAAAARSVPKVSGGTCPGYLVTITSQAENDFVQQRVKTSSWIGASDSREYIRDADGNLKYANQTAAEGNWHWVTGPEAGTQFLSSNSRTAVVNGEYNGFDTGEPNNSSPGENFAQIFTNGAWNDLSGVAAAGSGQYNVQAYIVEYGSPTCAPAVSASQATASFSVSAVLTVTPANISTCGAQGDYFELGSWRQETASLNVDQDAAEGAKRGPQQSSNTWGSVGDLRVQGLTRTPVQDKQSANLTSVPSAFDDSKYIALPFTTASGKRQVLWDVSFSLDEPVGTFTSKVQAKLFKGVDPVSGAVAAETSLTNVNVSASLIVELNPTVLDASSQYELRIYAYEAAFDSVENSTPLDNLTVRTKPCLSGAANSLAVSNVLLETATATWSAPTQNGGATITNYEYSLDNGATWITPAPPSSSTSKSLTGLMPGTSYSMHVRPVTAAGTGPASSVNFVTKVGTPESIQATAGTNSVSVSWPAVPNASGYKVEYSTDGGVTWIEYVASPVVSASVTISNLDTSAEYTFRVFAKNSEEALSGASPLSGSVRPSAPVAAPAPTASPTPTPTPTRNTPRQPPPSPSPNQAVVVLTPTPTTTPTPTPIPSPNPTGQGGSILMPVLDPTPNVVYGSSNPIPPALVDALRSPLAYLLELLTGSPELPSLASTESMAYENGSPVQIQLVKTDFENGYVLIGDGWQVALEATDSSGEPLRLDDSGNIILNSDRFVQFSGTGFAPGSIVKVWLFSDPTEISEVLADANGNFVGQAQLPEGITVGEHTIQLNGLTKDGQLRSVALGVLVQPALAVAPAAQVGFDLSGLMNFLWVIAAGVLTWFFIVWRRRRKKEEEGEIPNNSGFEELPIFASEGFEPSQQFPNDSRRKIGAAAPPNRKRFGFKPKDA
jgi:hypothetical protein